MGGCQQIGLNYARASSKLKNFNFALTVDELHIIQWHSKNPLLEREIEMFAQPFLQFQKVRKQIQLPRQRKKDEKKKYNKRNCIELHQYSLTHITQIPKHIIFNIGMKPFTFMQTLKNISQITQISTSILLKM